LRADAARIIFLDPVHAGLREPGAWEVGGGARSAEVSGRVDQVNGAFHSSADRNAADLSDAGIIPSDQFTQIFSLIIRRGPIIHALLTHSNTFSARD
jgi:hypothetical protein